MIYHEHLYYYSLIALEQHFARHEMKVFDVSHRKSRWVIKVMSSVILSKVAGNAGGC